MTYTPADKLACVERELAFRRRVYARRVDAGKMSQKNADKEIGCMEAIRDDYKREVDKGDLFGGRG